jgi:hypothetical protein
MSTNVCSVANRRPLAQLDVLFDAFQEGLTSVLHLIRGYTGEACVRQVYARHRVLSNWPLHVRAGRTRAALLSSRSALWS